MAAGPPYCIVLYVYAMDSTDCDKQCSGRLDINGVRKVVAYRMQEGNA